VKPAYNKAMCEHGLKARACSYAPSDVTKKLKL